jgi:hypothetical protein
MGHQEPEPNEPGIQRASTELLESNGRGLVPHKIPRTEILDQHDHVKRIDGRVNASAKEGSHVVSSPPGQRESDAQFTKIVGNMSDPCTRTTVRGMKIEGPAPQLGLH